ncbi:MAG: hypothetical protein QOE41_351 [Mycobacterium sp.]|jgi:hypothetical protein|nr:hypothetical protein [Mycobacterium sp.]MDT5131040.1 hypothetical protein [Mycobacterium sp.]
MSDPTNLRQLVDHLEARISDRVLDQDTLAVAVADLVNVVSLLEKQITQLSERLDRIDRSPAN